MKTQCCTLRDAENDFRLSFTSHLLSLAVWRQIKDTHLADKIAQLVRSTEEHFPSQDSGALHSRKAVDTTIVCSREILACLGLVIQLGLGPT